jgi:arsenite methyltransferase
MATACPFDLDVERLRAEVRATYTRLVHEPGADFHFHRGIDYACRVLRYERSELESLPPDSTACIAGLGNPLRIGPIHPGELVVDVGSGAGTDLLLAARRTGPQGKVIGVDPTPAMRERALRSAAEAGLGDVVELREGDSESLPLEPASADVLISNGVLNLAPDKGRAFREIVRVLRPGGRLYLADVVIQTELTEKSRRDADLWAA